jgi:hypothetical protein
MSEAFSINREFDFVRLEGLRRATGRPAHEWDLYIVKELVDNALDADETIWQADPTRFPEVKIRIEYIHLPERKSCQLFVRVQNRADFPVAQLPDVFATEKYTSSKTFVKGLTRGALGNALKTLLGIPYTLHNRATGEWRTELKPMSIVCQGREYQPRYLIDRTAQSIQFECAAAKSRRQPGTIISVGVDAFDQERPRTLHDIQQLATLYHLVNPHARFEWTVEMAETEWRQVYEPDLAWRSKYLGPAPAQWYFAAAFQDLLAALYRKQFDEDEDQLLPLTAVTPYFAGLSDQDEVIAAALEQTAIDKAAIEDQTGTKLYQLFVQHSPRFNAASLGQVGTAHLCRVIAQSLPADGEVLYAQTADNSDPNIPFVLEAAVAYLSEGAGREVWTAVNFTPTYGDPFMRVLLNVPAQPDDPVMGLRGLLDAYGLTEETPVALCLHLVCPNVEHSEFSKTDINHLPFKEALATLLDGLLAQLQQAREEAALRLQELVFQALDKILEQLGANERFIFSQLLEKLKAVLSQDPELATWLAQPDAEARLRNYISRYELQNTVFNPAIARQSAGTLTLPLHPDRYFSLLVEHLTPDLLAQHHVNKILYVQEPAFEPMVLENQWLCQMDMALLHSVPSPDELRSSLVQLASRCRLPIMALHDATQTAQAAVAQMHEWLASAGVASGRLVDLGLSYPPESDDQPARLAQMMPSELAAWLLARLQTLDIAVKWMPDPAQIRRDVSQQMEQSLQMTVWEGLGPRLAFGRLLTQLDREFGLTDTMIALALDERVRQRLGQAACTDSYQTVLDEVVVQFHTDFMRQHGTTLQGAVKAHMRRLKEKWTE